MNLIAGKFDMLSLRIEKLGNFFSVFRKCFLSSALRATLSTYQGNGGVGIYMPMYESLVRILN